MCCSPSCITWRHSRWSPPLPSNLCWTARRLQAADGVLGIAAGVLLVAGLARVFWFEKGAAYYFHSHAFLMKFSLFIIIGLLSIVPTVEFLSWRNALKRGELPAVAARSSGGCA